MNWVERWNLKRLFKHQNRLETYIDSSNRRLKQYKRALRQVKDEIRRMM